MADNLTDRFAGKEPSPPALPKVEDEDSTIDIGAVFQVLRRGKRTILWVSLTFLVLATICAFVLPFTFTSNVSFIPPNLSTGNSLASALAGQLAALGAGDIIGSGKGSGELYSGILKSRSVLGTLVKRFDLMRLYKTKKQSQAEGILESNTAIAIDPKSSIITISVSANSPVIAHDLASGYMDALQATTGRLAFSQSSQRRLFFGQQLAKEKDDLEDAEVNLKKTEEQSGMIAPSGQTAVQIETVAQTQAQIAMRQVQLAALRISATEQNPELIRLRSEIGDLQGQLARLQNGAGKLSTATIPTSKVPQLQLEYVRKEREDKYHEALFEMLSRQYESARLDEARDAPVLQVLDPASYPDTKSSPKRLYYMLGGLVFGFISSCVWVLIRDPMRALRASVSDSGAD